MRTELENKVYDFIKGNTDPETMELVDINDLVKGIGTPATVLRGVLASLVKKGLVEVEEWDGNARVQHFYWTKNN